MNSVPKIRSREISLQARTQGRGCMGSDLPQRNETVAKMAPVAKPLALDIAGGSDLQLLL